MGHCARCPREISRNTGNGQAGFFGRWGAILMRAMKTAEKDHIDFTPASGMELRAKEGWNDGASPLGDALF